VVDPGRTAGDGGRIGEYCLTNPARRVGQPGSSDWMSTVTSVAFPLPSGTALTLIVACLLLPCPCQP
jgi:hypothetical protein